MRGDGVEMKKIRIFFSDGMNRELARKKDGIIKEINEGYVRFIDIKNGNDEIIPMNRIIRIVFLEGLEGKDGENKY